MRAARAAGEARQRGQRQRAREHEAHGDDDDPGALRHLLAPVVERRARRADERAEGDEHEPEPEHERRDPAQRLGQAAACAQVVDGRAADGREVGRDERQHARRRERERTRAERRCERRRAHSSRASSSSSCCSRRSRSASGSADAGASTARQRRASSTASPPPASTSTVGASQASAPKPERGVSASTSGPYCGLERVLGRGAALAARAQALELAPDLVGLRRARLVEPRLAGRAHQLGRELRDRPAALGRRAGAERPERARDQRRGREQRDDGQERRPEPPHAASARLSARSIAASVGRPQSAATSRPRRSIASSAGNEVTPSARCACSAAAPRAVGRIGSRPGDGAALRERDHLARARSAPTAAAASSAQSPQLGRHERDQHRRAGERRERRAADFTSGSSGAAPPLRATAMRT